MAGVTRKGARVGRRAGVVGAEHGAGAQGEVGSERGPGAAR